MADRRITPVRADLAASHLKGQVDAARFADGTDYCVVRGRIALRAAPDSAASQETELLHGERFTVYEEKSGWCWGQAALDGYVGYAHLVSLCEASAPTHRVIALSTPLLTAPDVKSVTRDLFPLNAKLRIDREEGGFARVQGGYVALRHLAPIAARQPDFVAVAERFLGVPYVWGGKTQAGCDCSGLIQTSLEAAGISAPRDTDMMEAQLGDAFTNRELKRGDLIFWKGHMGVMRDAHILLHANAFHMEVFSEPLAEAIARIEQSAGPVTSVKRL
jgi:cell wall-associated NlpC family hydrolase